MTAAASAGRGRVAGRQEDLHVKQALNRRRGLASRNDRARERAAKWKAVIHMRSSERCSLVSLASCCFPARAVRSTWAGAVREQAVRGGRGWTNVKLVHIAIEEQEHSLLLRETSIDNSSRPGRSQKGGAQQFLWGGGTLELDSGTPAQLVCPSAGRYE